MNHKEEVIKILKRKIESLYKNYEKEVCLKKELENNLKTLKEESNKARENFEEKTRENFEEKTRENFEEKTRDLEKHILRSDQIVDHYKNESIKFRNNLLKSDKFLKEEKFKYQYLKIK